MTNYKLRQNPWIINAQFHFTDLLLTSLDPDTLRMMVTAHFAYILLPRSFFQVIDINATGIITEACIELQCGQELLCCVRVTSQAFNGCYDVGGG